MGQLFPYSFTNLKPGEFLSAAVTTSAVVSVTPPDNVKGALIQATGAALHWTNDGTAPVTGAGGGMVLPADAEPQWFGGSDIAGLKFIAAGANAFLLVSFYS